MSSKKQLLSLGLTILKQHYNYSSSITITLNAGNLLVIFWKRRFISGSARTRSVHCECWHVLPCSIWTYCFSFQCVCEGLLVILGNITCICLGLQTETPWIIYQCSFRALGADDPHRSGRLHSHTQPHVQNTQTHTLRRICKHTLTHTHMHTQANAQTHTHTHTCGHWPWVPAYNILAATYPCGLRSHIHTHTHTQAHTVH